MLTKLLMIAAMIVAPGGTTKARPEHPRVDFDRLFAAVSYVESRGNPRAFRADEDAAGIVQIRRCVVTDCNRTATKHHWTLRDRFDRGRSSQMVEIYLSYWGREYERETGRHPTAEVYARMWKGGPLGWRKASTVEYWWKVKARLGRASTGAAAGSWTS
jgi:hypothetical protein